MTDPGQGCEGVTAPRRLAVLAALLLVVGAPLAAAVGAVGAGAGGSPAPVVASQPTETPTSTGSPTPTPTPTPVTADLSLSATAEVTVVNATATNGSAGTAAVATVEITLRNEGGNDSVAPVVRVDRVPPGWRVVGQSSDNGTWRSATREWLWLTVPPGESVAATLELRATGDATGGEVALVAVDEGENRAAESVDIERESTAAPGDDGGLAAVGGVGPVVLGAAGLLVLVALAVAVTVVRRVGGG